MISAATIQQRLLNEYFGARVLENNLRGYWCEAMVAEALGPKCRITSGGWAPWDLQIGDDDGVASERLRIQVKNSARLQTWHGPNSTPSDAQFNLSFRARPAYWTRDFPNRPCKEAGFLCDLFALCFHPIDDPEIADQRDPSQWMIFLLSASPDHGDITAAEYASCERAFQRSGKPSALQRRPDSLIKGIRGRRPGKVVSLNELTLETIHDVLCIPQD